jgi:hypothetical protein
MMRERRHVIRTKVTDKSERESKGEEGIARLGPKWEVSGRNHLVWYDTSTPGEDRGPCAGAIRLFGNMYKKGIVAL